MFIPEYSAFCKKQKDGTVTLTICVEGFSDIVEAREFLRFFLDEDVADDMQGVLI